MAMVANPNNILVDPHDGEHITRHRPNKRLKTKAKMMMTTTLMILVSFLWVVVVTASSDLAWGTTSPSGKLPPWLSIHRDKEKMSEYLQLARDRHLASIQKARDAYFHGGPKESSAFDLDKLLFDERNIEAAGTIPDFVDELERRCFVTSKDTPLFSREECKDMITKAENHFAGKEWTTLPSGQYDVAGFWIKSIPECHEWFNRMVQERLFPLLVKKFPHFCPQMEDLVVDNAYLFKYTPETGRRTDVHTDSGCLSFTIALNGKDEYSGGGTWFEGLQGGEDDSCVIEMDVGGCTVRPGGVRHCGNAVLSGTRYIIGGFCMNVNKVEYVRMLMGLGSEESQKGNYKKAEEALEAAIALNPNFDGPYSHLADLLTKQGNKAKAQQVLEHCLEHVNPKGSEIAYSLGTTYLEQGEYDKATRCIKVCLEIDDCDVDAMMAMAQICTGRHDNAGEEAWLQRIISTPGASKEVAGKAYCNLGVIYADTEKEVEYYEKSLELAPDRFPSLYSLGCAYASQQKWDSAVSAFRKAIDVADDGSDDEKQALANLYRVTMAKLQHENRSGTSSREEMMKMFMDVMGEANFRKLSASRQ
jgi:tetratricopeptide (TPR) repeat protein